jgi:hypothetical protein
MFRYVDDPWCMEGREEQIMAMKTIFSLILGFRRTSRSAIRVGYVLLNAQNIYLTDNKHIIWGEKRRSIVLQRIFQVSILSTCDCCRERMPSCHMPHYAQAGVRDTIYKRTE